MSGKPTTTLLPPTCLRQNFINQFTRNGSDQHADGYPISQPLSDRRRITTPVRHARDNIENICDKSADRHSARRVGFKPPRRPRDSLRLTKWH
jgi:hypothetical protein